MGGEPTQGASRSIAVGPGSATQAARAPDQRDLGRLIVISADRPGIIAAVSQVLFEQDVQRVDHRHMVEDVRRMGRYIERVVLARAVAWHCGDRVLLDGKKTIVFA
jgi:formyltetrahydrofolate hydrolase